MSVQFRELLSIFSGNLYTALTAVSNAFAELFTDEMQFSCGAAAICKTKRSEPSP
jgi:hypothetical protein